QIEEEIQISLEESATQSATQILVPSLALFRIAVQKHRWFKESAANPGTGLGTLIPPLVKRLEDQLDKMDLPDAHDEIPSTSRRKFYDGFLQQGFPSANIPVTN
ncbi:MAG: hypothetical protein GY770_31055, partial [Aestuariibacter sp.]|nr:hypothetical protein [Aestuariibacter sp.]